MTDKSLLVRESLTYGLACAETAFVAVRSEAGEKISGSVIVPSALPTGWSDQFLSAAAGAKPMMAFAAAPPPSAAQPMGVGAALGVSRRRLCSGIDFRRAP